MKKLKSALAVVLAVVLLLSMSSSAFAAQSVAYWHEKQAASTDPYYLDWMKQLPDGLHLSELSIPETHDSMTFDGVTGNITFNEKGDANIATAYVKGSDNANAVWVGQGAVTIQ